MFLLAEFRQTPAVFRRQALTSQLPERHQFDGTWRRACDVTSDSCRVKLTSIFTSDSRIQQKILPGGSHSFQYDRYTY